MKKSEEIRAIQKLVAAHFGLTVETLVSHSKKYTVATPRHIAVLIAYRITGLSSNELKETFGYIHHTGILWAIHVITERCAVDSKFRHEFFGLLKQANTAIAEVRKAA